MRLLAERPGSTIQELLPDWSAPQVTLLPGHAGSRHLLDLTYEESDIAERFGRDLLAHAGHLAEVQASLVVTVSQERWYLCAEEARELTEPLDLPDPEEVLRAHLHDQDGSGTRLTWLDVAPLSELVADLRRQRRAPKDMADLAASLVEVQDLQVEFERVKQQMHRWKNYLDTRLADVSGRTPPEQQTKLQQRALMIACAVLDGRPAQTIFQSADRLLAEIKAAPSPHHLLSGPELSDLVDGIDAEHSDDTISILGRHPGLDVAVLDRVWVQRPQLRRHLLTWLEAISSERGPAAKHVDRVADVLTELAVRHGSLDVLDIIEKWLSGEANQRRLGVSTLEALAVNPVIGSAVRRRLRQWAEQKSTDKGVLKGVAAVCGGRLGATLPSQALLRLRLIAQRDDRSQVLEAVTSALRALAQYKERRLLVVQQVVDWLSVPTTYRAGSVALLALLDLNDESAIGALLLNDSVTDSALRAALCSGWSLLLQDQDEDVSQEAVRVANQWIASADSGVLDGNAVVEMLVPIVRSAIPDRIGALILDRSDSSTRTRLLEAVLHLPYSPQAGTKLAQEPEQG